MKRLWTQEELVEHWTLTPDELALLGNKAGATRLGFVVMLKVFQHEVPAPVVAFLARQVGVPTAAYLEYDWGGRAIKYHRAQIREYLGVREVTLADADAVVGWLVAHVLDHQHQPDALRAAAQGRFRALRLEPPTPKQLTRLVRSALHTWEARLFAATLARLPPATVAALDTLVATRPDEATAGVADGQVAPETSAFAALRADPGAVGLASVEAEIAKLTTIRTLDLPADLFRDVGPAVLAKYRQRAGAEWPRELRAHAPGVRATLLAAFCTLRAREITDGLVELLLHVVQRIGVRVERRVEGVMIYWHVERKSACIYSQLKSCSSSEVAAMIEGVLRHCTQMAVEKNYVDSHGQSEVAFAFTRLLGFQLLPRLKGLKRQKLYRPEAGQPDAYPRLQPVLTRPIDWELIRRQYDELVKYATALRLGTTEPEAILRHFTRANVQHPTYRALAELGKAQKTLFLCQYLSSEALRREIHEGLNVIENWNSANGFIFYGRGGELASNRPEQQEVAMLCLHLVQLALEYVNVLMLQRLLAAPGWAEQMTPADWRALTPLLYHHVTPYGTFKLDLAARLPLGDEEDAA